MSNICFLLSCLMVPLSFGLLDLQSTLPVNSAEHTLFEVLILLAVFWLIWLLNRFDHWLYLHNIPSETKHLRPQTRIVETCIFTAETSLPSDGADDKQRTGETEKRVPGSSATLAIHKTRGTLEPLAHRNGQ